MSSGRSSRLSRMTASGPTPAPTTPLIGAALPTAGAGVTPDDIVTVAQTAERLGLASIWAFERLLRTVSADGENPYGLPPYYASVLDPLEALTWAAAHTSRVRLGTSVLDTLFHPPVVLAKRIATLDLLSAGRAVIGVGQGWMPEEFAATGVPLSRRGAGFEDHLAAMRACWGPDPVEYEGTTYAIARSEIGPKPAAGRIPLLIGANARPSIERAARIGDGFAPVLMDWDTTATELRWYRDAGGAGPVVLRLNVTDAAAIATDLERAAAHGIDEVLVELALTGLDVPAQCEVLEELAAARR